MAGLVATQNAQKAVDRLFGIRRAYGLLEKDDFERYYRDVRMGTLVANQTPDWSENGSGNIFLAFRQTFNPGGVKTGFQLTNLQRGPNHYHEVVAAKSNYPRTVRKIRYRFRCLACLQAVPFSSPFYCPIISLSVVSPRRSPIWAISYIWEIPVPEHKSIRENP